VTLTPHTF